MVAPTTSRSLGLRRRTPLTKKVAVPRTPLCSYHVTHITDHALYRSMNDCLVRQMLSG